ncbi:phage baseplate assembly protein V [Candidatus Pacearchaeota archaeon]|jgi:uncharacterized protein involved in type VI secretion and phage assembly|nr:phage baseplate assembly protein V [Candidatus Pacearchaeota archaeon]
MNYHAIVDNITDPQNLGRVRVKIIGFREDVAGMNLTPWCHACTPFAGNGYGFFSIPQVGDEVIVSQLYSGNWFVQGYHWSGRKAKPTEGAAGTRIFKTPSGHKMSFTESGSILIQTSGGSKVELKSSGDIDITAEGNINLNGSDGGGVVCKKHRCSYTGYDHAAASPSVKAEK